MKKQPKPKLALAKDTIALLTENRLDNVAGGKPNPTRSCFVFCLTVFATC